MCFFKKKRKKHNTHVVLGHMKEWGKEPVVTEEALDQSLCCQIFIDIPMIILSGQWWYFVLQMRRWMDRGVDKEDTAHIHNGILYSHKEVRTAAIRSNMGGYRDSY